MTYSNPTMLPKLAEWQVYGNEQQGRFLTVYPKNPSSLNYSYADIVRYGEKPSLDILDGIFARNLGRKAYELKDHLGNVRTTFSDIKMPTGSGTQPFMVDLLSKSEYYPYGMKINDLSYNATGARYGYNGTHEMDNEVKGGVGKHLSFGDFGYDTRVARRFNLDPIDQVSKSNYVTFANNPIFYSDPTGFKEYESMEAFKNETDNDKLGEGDWLTADRENNKDQWKNANLYNLQNQLPEEYTAIDQRRDFYKWFQGYSTNDLGFQTKWAGAAYKIANGIYIADNTFGLINDEIDKFNDSGNEMIFNNVFPKLKNLINGPVLKGDKAKEWDSKTLAEEQYLINPLYQNLSNLSFIILDLSAKYGSNLPYINNRPYPILKTIKQPENRWLYGMKSMGYKNTKIDDFPKISWDYILPFQYYLFK